LLNIHSRLCVLFAVGGAGLFCRVGVEEEFELGGVKLFAFTAVDDANEVVDLLFKQSDLFALKTVFLTLCDDDFLFVVVGLTHTLTTSRKSFPF
jgi:hypothetical protein